MRRFMWIDKANIDNNNSSSFVPPLKVPPSPTSNPFTDFNSSPTSWSFPLLSVVKYFSFSYFFLSPLIHCHLLLSLFPPLSFLYFPVHHFFALPSPILSSPLLTFTLRTLRYLLPSLQGSSFIPGPRLIWNHPYTRQLTVPYCFQFSVRSVNCRV